MKRLAGIAVFSVLAAGLVTAVAVAQNAPRPGPMPFSALDINKDGVVSKAEFEKARAKRRAAMKAAGRLGRNQAFAPSFEKIDANGDGVISKEEFVKFRAENMGRRGMGRMRRMQ